MAPGPGIWAAERSIQVFSTFGIFVLSGLGLRRKQAAQALQSWGAALFGFISILVITPLAGFAALRLPLHPPELALGLAVFCCMPCTLSSGVSLTQVAHPSCFTCALAAGQACISASRMLTWPSSRLAALMLCSVSTC